MANVAAPSAIEYTAMEKQKNASSRKTIPEIFGSEGLAPAMELPCMVNITMENGTETADGMAMIPTNSQKWLRYRRNVRSSSSPIDIGLSSVASIHASTMERSAYNHAFPVNASVHSLMGKLLFSIVPFFAKRKDSRIRSVPLRRIKTIGGPTA